MSGIKYSTVYNVTAKETEPWTKNPDSCSRINGSVDEILARYCVSELCKGWPVYRDSSEWDNYRALFTEKDAYVWTTWSGRLSIEDFIAVSKVGRQNGDFIMHRENGTMVNLNLSKNRAVGKMKATITQRFKMAEYDKISQTNKTIEFDVDCDCRFIFFCLCEGEQWKIKYVKLFYEKDKICPVDGKTLPTIRSEDLASFTEGYRYLGWAQQNITKARHQVLQHLPTMNNEAFDKMYEAMATWLSGEDIDLDWEVRQPELSTSKGSK